MAAERFITTATTKRPAPATPVSAVQAICDKTFRGIGNLIKLLPTGTVFLFQFLTPILTNNGHCSAANRVLTGILLSVCAFSCCFSSFTDSYKGVDGKVYYGIATSAGMWTFYDSNPAPADVGWYRLRFGDFVHAFYSVVVLSVIGLLDSNTVSCFYPAFESNQKVLVMVLPPLVGGMSSVISMVFPNTRHGIGCPATTTGEN